MDTAQANNAEFIKPPAELLGLKLRPLAAGTSALMDQARWVLRQIVNEQYGAEPVHDLRCTDDRCVDDCKKTRRMFYAHFYYLAAWLYIHSEPLKTVCAAVWKPDALLPSLTEFISRFSEKDILASAKGIAEIEDAVKRAENFKVEGSEDEHPNE